MAGFILLAFIIVPILEIMLFIQMGSLLGFWPTIGCILLTAFIGTALLRQQGLSVMNTARAEMQTGQMPIGHVFDGACLLVAGILLLTPGFFTDTIGFALLIPSVRTALGQYLKNRVHVSATFSAAEAHSTYHHGQPQGSQQGDDIIIEGEYKDVTPSESPEITAPENQSPHKGS
jgi:UPF0716 protein FxsA